MASSPANNVSAQGLNGDSRNPVPLPNYAGPPATVILAANAVSMTGGNQPHANIQLRLCVNFIIATNYLYPLRS